MTRLGRSELTFGEFSDLDETLRRHRAGDRRPTCATLAAELVERPLSVAAVGADRRPALSTASAAPRDPAAGAACMSRYLYLVRHGEQQDAEHGLPDGPLSPRGVRQAQALADRLGGVPFTGAWTSPLQRAQETARIMTERMPALEPQPSAAADGLHPVGSRARHAARLRVVLRRGHRRARSRPARRRWRMPWPSG